MNDNMTTVDLDQIAELLLTPVVHFVFGCPKCIAIAGMRLLHNAYVASLNNTPDRSEIESFEGFVERLAGEYLVKLNPQIDNAIVNENN